MAERFYGSSRAGVFVTPLDAERSTPREALPVAKEPKAKAKKKDKEPVKDE